MAVVIRKARLSDIRGLARVHIDSWETTYRGLIPDEVLDRRTYEKAEGKWLARLRDSADTEFTFVAEVDAVRVVGFASGGEVQNELPPYKGEIHALYILKEYQGLGIGRMLVRASAQCLRESGLEPLVIWVLAGNPSRGFYERLGGRLAGSQFLDFAGTPIKEVAYVWDDLDIVLDQECPEPDI